MTIEKMMPELRFISDVGRAVLREIGKDERGICEIAETAYHGEDLEPALCRRMPLTRLATVTYLLLRKYDDYKAKEIPDGIIFDTFRDVSLRANLYYERNGKAGLSKEDVIWSRHIMNAEIFKIGSLQFQPFEMVYLDEGTVGEPYMTFSKEQKEALPCGTPVINCHIQQGADLSPRSVEAAFQNARRFFSKYFPTVRYKAFLCYSWLLYPPMLEHLSEKSNIKRFAGNFSIIGACNDPEQATGYLFGSGTGKALPVNATSLQKLAFEHIELFGLACGIFAI